MSRGLFNFKFFSIFFTALITLAVTASIAFAPITAAQSANPNADTSGDVVAKEDGTTCAIEKVGWILCPILEGAAKIADKTFSLLANNFLQVEPKLLADDGAKPAWELARNLANIMFVIAFLAIVYSQITGSGLNNYGIKRMLPRLIIAAIAVNVSFYICQILVDISNIMGYAIKEALSAASNTVGPSVLGGSPQGLDTETGNGVLTYITIGALATAGVVWLILGPTALIITAVLVTALTVIVILLLRKAILVLLVVASPIAFVMYLLPNTEKLFDKWLKMFWGLLMVFPVVAALFGGGQLASTIILMAGASTPSQNANAEQCVADAEKANAEKTQAQKDKEAVENGYTVPCEGMLSISSPDSQETAQAGWMLGLVATGIAVAPLLAVWSVLKGALAAAGAIGGRIASNVQKGSQGTIGGGGKKLKDAYGKSTVGQMRARDKKIREIDIRGGTYSGRGGRLNPRNARSNMNSALNSAGKGADGKTKSGFLNNQLGKYSDQRGRMASKDEAEYIRDKAQEFVALGNYGSDAEVQKHLGTLDNPNKSMSDKKDAENRLKAHRMAVGSQEGKGGIDAFDAKVLSNGGASSSNSYARSIAAQAHGRSATAAGSNTNPQAVGRQNTPSAIGSGGGAPSTNGPSNPGAERLSFMSTNTNGGIAGAQNGRQILGQMHNAGGAENVHTEDLVRAVGHAEQHLGGGGADVGHTEMATQAVEALAARGLDHQGNASGRPPGSTGPTGS